MSTYATLAQLKAALNIQTSDTSQDANLNTILGSVTAYIDDYTSRTWQGPLTVTSEEYDLPTNEQGIFFLRHMDITSITSLQIGSQFNLGSMITLVANQDYIWNSSGRVICPQYSTQWLSANTNDFSTPVGPLAGLGAILISYTYGLSAPTALVTSIALDIAQNLYTSKATQGVKREKIGDYWIEYQDADMINAAQDSLGALQSIRMRHI